VLAAHSSIAAVKLADAGAVPLLFGLVVGTDSRVRPAGTGKRPDIHMLNVGHPVQAIRQSALSALDAIAAHGGHLGDQPRAILCFS